MIQIFKWSNKAVKYELVGSVSGRVRDGVVFMPGHQTNYFKASVRASGYISGGTYNILTPDFFADYTDPAGDPWIVQILDEDGSKIAAGVIDPDSIEFDYRTIETTFNVVSPLWLLEVVGSVGGRNIYEIEPIRVGFQSIDGWYEIDVPRGQGLPYESWIQNDLGFVEWEDGLASVHSIVANRASWTIRISGVAIPRDYDSLSATVVGVYAVSNDLYRVKFQLDGFDTRMLDRYVTFIIPAGWFLGDTNKQNANTVVRDIRPTVSNGYVYIEVDLPNPGLTNWWMVNQTTTLRYVPIRALAEVTIKPSGKLYLIGKTYFNYDTRNGANPATMLKELLPNVSPVFSATKISSTGRPFVLLPWASPSPQPSKALEEIAAAAGAMVEVTWTDGDEPPTVKLRPMHDTSATRISLGDAVRSLKKSVARRRLAGVVVNYRGSNKNRDHVGFKNPLSGDTVPDADSTIRVDACTPISFGMYQLDDGTKVSPAADYLADYIYNFYNNFAEEATAEVEYNGGSLAGNIISIDLQSFTPSGPSVLGPTNWFVLEDQFDLGDGVHRLKLLAVSGVPTVNPSIVLSGPLGVKLNETAYFSAALIGSREKISYVRWRIYNAPSGGTLIATWTSGPTTSHQFSSPTYVARTYYVEAEITTDQTSTQIRSGRRTIVVMNPTITIPINSPIEIDDVRRFLDELGERRLKLASSDPAAEGAIADEDPETYENLVTNSYIQNPSFEEADDSGNMIPWVASPAAWWDHVYDPSASMSGQFVAQVTFPYGQTGSATLQQTVTGLPPGTRVRAVCLINAFQSGDVRNYSIAFAAIDSANNIIAVDRIIQGGGSFIFSGWYYYVLDFEVPPDGIVIYRLEVTVSSWNAGSQGLIVRFDECKDTVFQTLRTLISPRGVTVGSLWGETVLTKTEAKIGVREVKTNHIYFYPYGPRFAGQQPPGTGLLYAGTDGGLYWRYRSLDGTYTVKRLDQ